MKKTGDEYLDSEEFRELLATYEEAVSTGQPVFLDADELSEIADYYQMNEQMDKADEAINMALSLSPGAIMPLTYKIHEALYYNKVEEAEAYLDQIIETDEPDYIYDKTEIMLAKGLVDEADQMLQELLQELPADEVQDFVVDVANIFQENGLNKKALEWMQRSTHEETPDYKELMARTLFGLGKYKDSERLYNELIDTNPFSKRYWNALASTQFMREDYQGSVQSSEYALAIDPQDPDGLISKANGLFRLENYEEAAKYYQRYEEIVDNDDFSLLHHATCLLNTGHGDEGLDLLKRAATVACSEPYTDDNPSPFIADIFEELAFALSERGMTDEAMAYLNKTDALDCDHIQMTIVKGHILLAAGQYAEAEQMYQKAIMDSETPDKAFLRVAVSVYDNRYVETAYKMMKTYFTIVPPNNRDGYAYMALCCYDLKLHDEFLHYLLEACQRNPHECRMVLSHLFPEEVLPENYYDYMISS